MLFPLISETTIDFCYDDEMKQEKKFVAKHDLLELMCVKTENW